MNHQEKKYRVESFDDIQKKLLVCGATLERRVISIHYYGVHDGNDVEKFVVYPDRTEVHILELSEVSCW